MPGNRDPYGPSGPGNQPLGRLASMLRRTLNSDHTCMESIQGSRAWRQIHLEPTTKRRGGNTPLTTTVTVRVLDQELGANLRADWLDDCPFGAALCWFTLCKTSRALKCVVFELPSRRFGRHWFRQNVPARAEQVSTLWSLRSRSRNQGLLKPNSFSPLC